MLMGSTTTIIVGGVGGLAALVAAIFWLWASLAPVPDNQDTFISALHWVSKLNSIGAMAAAVAAVCGMLVFWFGRQPAYVS